MSLLISYATETGNAEDVAESLWRECRQRNVRARVVAFELLTLEDISRENVAIFVVATSGQGEFPTQARSLWRRFRLRSLASDLMNKVNFSLVALGDSSYQKYNRAGRLLRARLIGLGANEMSPVAYCDDQHELGIDGALTPWKEDFFKALRNVDTFQNIEDNQDKINATTFPPKFELHWCDDPIDEPSGSEYIPVPVISNQRLTALEHFQDTRLIVFDTADQPTLRYSPGDVLMVQPRNLDESMRIVIEAMSLSDQILDRRFRLQPTDENIRLPPNWLIGSVTTLRICLERLFDLQHIPKKSFFEVLSKLSKDPDEAERLRELCAPENLDELLDYTTRAKRTAAETLRDFYKTTSALTPEQLFDVLPMIRPRAFSIASCPLTHLGNIELLVAKVEYKSPIARKAAMRRGLCSTYLSRLEVGDKVLIRVREGTFRFPPPEVPVICVGPGTGVAPFRSLINYRLRTLPESRSILFFGCRGRLLDYYFEMEWQRLEKIAHFVAFSRDQQQKVYVQHLIKENGDTVWDFIEDGAYIFVAGSAGDMPKAVCEAIDEIGTRNGRENFADTLEKANRLQFETWS